MDEATFIRRYIDQTHQTVEEVARALRRSVQYVQSRLAVSEMPDYMRDYLKEGKMKLGVALAMFKIPNEALREKWTHLAVQQGISVASAEFQATDYFANRVIYDGIVQEAKDRESMPEPKAVMFRCAIDGKEYDARLCRTLIVSEKNMEIFNAFVSEFRSVPSQN